MDRHGRWTRLEPDVVVLGAPGRRGRGRAWSGAEPICPGPLATSPRCPRRTGVLNAFALLPLEGEGGCQKRTQCYGGEGILGKRQVGYRSLTELGRSPDLLTPLPRRYPTPRIPRLPRPHPAGRHGLSSMAHLCPFCLPDHTTPLPPPPPSGLKKPLRPKLLLLPSRDMGEGWMGTLPSLRGYHSGSLTTAEARNLCYWVDISNFPITALAECFL